MSAHADHPAMMPDEWPEDADWGRATTAKLGMWVFLLSDAFMFAGLLLGYGILRGGSEQWIPEGEPEFGIPFTAFLTFLLICSSLSMVLSHAALTEKNLKWAKIWLALTILGGVGFLMGQVFEYWGHAFFIFPMEGHGLLNHGLTFGASARASTFYVVTSFHGCHVFAGVTYLSVVLYRMMRGKYDDGNYNHLEVAGLFWHFVDLVWIMVFTLIYLL
jgi:cytochrome c oxidase subunit 3